MSKAWSARNVAERKMLEVEFVARHGAELLLDGDLEEESATCADIDAPPRRLPFAELYAALRRPGPLPVTVTRALHEDRRLRDDFSLLLQRCAWLHVPRAAAAAGRGALRRREVGGFSVRIVESRASRNQVYLLIDLPEMAFRRVAVSDRAGTRDRTGAGPVREQDAADSEASSDAEKVGSAGDETRSETVADTKAAAPSQLVVKTAAEAFLKQNLPPPEDLTIRLVMAADDPLVQAFGEPASEIFLL